MHLGDTKSGVCMHTPAGESVTYAEVVELCRATDQTALGVIKSDGRALLVPPADQVRAYIIINSTVGWMEISTSKKQRSFACIMSVASKPSQQQRSQSISMQAPLHCMLACRSMPYNRRDSITSATQQQAPPSRVRPRGCVATPTHGSYIV